MTTNPRDSDSLAPYDTRATAATNRTEELKTRLISSTPNDRNRSSYAPPAARNASQPTTPTNDIQMYDVDAVVSAPNLVTKAIAAVTPRTTASRTKTARA